VESGAPKERALFAVVAGKMAQVLAVNVAKNRALILFSGNFAKRHLICVLDFGATQEVAR